MRVPFFLSGKQKIKSLLGMASIFLALSFLFFSCTSCDHKDCRTVYNRQIEKQHVHPDPAVQKNTFNTKWLKKKGEFYYTKKGAPYRVVNGVDISRHQGIVDFDLLRKNGYEFVFLRLAYRRYGYESGNLVKDENFDRYYEDAKQAGFKVGVYVYSQAINDEEALEEARIVIDNLKPYMLDLPVVYDPEFVFYDEARTDMVSEDVFCRNTQLFLDAVEAEGFKTMIYANLMWEFFVFTPELLRRNDIWFAQYSKKPTSPYKFTFWQYSGASQIEGVETPCDMNVWFIPNEEIWEDPIMPDSPILEGSSSPESTDLDEDVILDESAGSQMVEYESPAVPLP
ncbi:MAG: hypothetical protein MJZ50_04735 [Treponema sp.]|nr:hypothetical protein [Treponema sp.]